MNENNFLKKSYFSVFIISLLVGFLSGGLGAWSYNRFLNSNTTSENQNSTETQEYTSSANEEQSTISVVESVSPAVVSIIVRKEIQTRSNGPRSMQDFFFGFPGFDFFFPNDSQNEGEYEEREVGAGTGFLISEEGMIVTNRHVVEDEEADYVVLTNDGQEHKAEVLARDPILDLAVLKINVEKGIYKPLMLGDSNEIKIGQTVIAIGNTLGEFSNTVTKGVISGIGRRVTAGGMGSAEVIEEAIQTDAAISSGNSGGPLLNLQGKVIGINTAVSNIGENIGFAIPSNEARRIVDSINEYGRIVRPYLGVRYLMLNEGIANINNLDIDEGALVVRGDSPGQLAVVPGSPADKAGLEENDIIVKVNETEITQDHSLARVLARFKPGDTVTLTIIHDEEEKTAEATLEEFQDE